MTVTIEIYDSGGRMYANKPKRRKFKNMIEVEKWAEDKDMYEGEDYNVVDSFGGVF